MTPFEFLVRSKILLGAWRGAVVLSTVSWSVVGGCRGSGGGEEFRCDGPGHKCIRRRIFAQRRSTGNGKLVLFCRGQRGSSSFSLEWEV